MTPMSATLSHLRLLVLWVTESFVSCVCTKPTMCPGLSTTTGSSSNPHTAPAHTQKAARHPSVPSAGGKSKSSWHSPQSPSTFQTPGTFCWSNTIFFYWLTPSQHLALSAGWWNSTGQWSAGKLVPIGLQRSTSPTAICTRPLESLHSALSLPKPPPRCACCSLISLSPALADCSAFLLGQLNSYAEHCSAGGDLRSSICTLGGPLWTSFLRW